MLIWQRNVRNTLIRLVAHRDVNIYTLPAVDRWLETRTVDDRLGYGQIFELDVDLLVLIRILILVVHLIGDVDGVIPFRVISQDGIDGQDMLVGDIRAVSEDPDVENERAFIDGGSRKGLCGTSHAYLAWDIFTEDARPESEPPNCEVYCRLGTSVMVMVTS